MRRPFGAYSIKGQISAFKNVMSAGGTSRKSAKKRSLQTVNEHSETVCNAVTSSAIVLRRADKGQTLVEFALIVLLLVVLLFGLMEFARAWQYSNAITNGVRDGARYASTLDNTTGFETSVRSYTFSRITSAIPRDSLVVTVTAEDEGGNSVTPGPDLSAGDRVTVDALYQFEILTGSIIPFFSGTKPLYRQATMRYE